jgi:RNA polymerase sigma-70 factor (ECF subfamily)
MRFDFSCHRDRSVRREERDNQVLIETSHVACSVVLLTTVPSWHQRAYVCVLARKGVRATLVAVDSGALFRMSSALSTRLAEARAAYPGVVLSDAMFVTHVTSKLVDGATLEAVRTTDLFLACACAERDPVAIGFLERDTFGEIAAAHRRFRKLGVPLDDLVQRMRERLLFASPPTLLTYAGIGPLRAWVRASALNSLINISQREMREKPTDGDLLDMVMGADPAAEAAYVKLACRADFEAALDAALRTLSDRDTVMLRHAFVDRRTVDAIGALYAVHRATAARWVAVARMRLVEATLDDLTRRLGISRTEAQSLVAAGLTGGGSLLLARLRSHKSVPAAR